MCILFLYIEVASLYRCHISGPCRSQVCHHQAGVQAYRTHTTLMDSLLLLNIMSQQSLVDDGSVLHATVMSQTPSIYEPTSLQSGVITS